MEQKNDATSDYINYVKINVSFFLPALMEISGEKDFGWDKIDRLFLSKLDDWKQQAKGETINVDATIFGIIVAAKKGNNTAIGLLHFLNNVFEELSDLLTDKEKYLVRSNIKNMLTALDLRFYDFVGEIATLNNLMKTKAYRLEEVEMTMPNGRTIDFSFRLLVDNSLLQVEIMNIHLDSDRVIDEPIAIEKFLNHRITEKIAQKKAGLIGEFEFHLIPVLWGMANDLKVYSKHFKNHQLHIKNVIEPIGYLTYTDNNGYYKHFFKRISTLFQD